MSVKRRRSSAPCEDVSTALLPRITARNRASTMVQPTKKASGARKGISSPAADATKVLGSEPLICSRKAMSDAQLTASMTDHSADRIRLRRMSIKGR